MNMWFFRPLRDLGDRKDGPLRWVPWYITLIYAIYGSTFRLKTAKLSSLNYGPLWFRVQEKFRVSEHKQDVVTDLPTTLP